MYFEYVIVDLIAWKVTIECRDFFLNNFISLLGVISNLLPTIRMKMFIIAFSRLLSRKKKKTKDLYVVCGLKPQLLSKALSPKITLS